MAKEKKASKKTHKNTKSIQTSRDVLNSYKTDTSSMVKCGIIVLIIFAIMYLLTTFIINKSKADYITKNNDKTTIQYSEILSGQVFNRKDDEYLVLFYDYNNDTAYTTLLSDYEAKDEHTAIYYVDLGNRMNKNCVSNESNESATKSTELKVNGPTLIKFVNNQITDYIEGEESITNYLK